MNYNTLQDQVTQGKSIAKIAHALSTSKSNIRYWLKKYNLQTLKLNTDIKEKLCSRCQLIKPIDQYYNRRNKQGNSVYCKPCTKNQTIERQRAFKQKCIEYKGGKCIICSYSKCNTALKFHHLDPSKKEFAIANFKLNTFDSKIKNELDKCILVCGNCHDEIHSGLIPEFGSPGGI